MASSTQLPSFAFESNIRKARSFIDGDAVGTEFNRTIAAYTPLKWEGSNGKWIADPSLRSFLLQLELKEKMTLIQGQESKATFTSQISATKIATVFPIFPLLTTAATNSGAQNGKYFRVLEYEVFQVIK